MDRCSRRRHIARVIRGAPIVSSGACRPFPLRRAARFRRPVAVPVMNGARDQDGAAPERHWGSSHASSDHEADPHASDDDWHPDEEDDDGPEQHANGPAHAVAAHARSEGLPAAPASRKRPRYAGAPAAVKRRAKDEHVVTVLDDADVKSERAGVRLESSCDVGSKLDAAVVAQEPRQEHIAAANTGGAAVNQQALLSDRDVVKVEAAAKTDGAAVKPEAPVDGAAVAKAERAVVKQELALDDDVILVCDNLPAKPARSPAPAPPSAHDCEGDAEVSHLRAEVATARGLVHERHRLLNEATAVLRSLEERLAERRAAVRRAADAAFDWGGRTFAWDAPLARALEDVFHIKAFRPLQRESLNATLMRRDVYAILPTGAGKSLIYQLAAVVDRGLTLVVAPLISLSMDQRTSLRSLGISAESLDSMTAKAVVKRIYDIVLPRNGKVRDSARPRKKKHRVEKVEKKVAKRRLVGGDDWVPDDMETTILFVTPEQVVRSKRLMNRVEMMYEEGHLSRIVVDEAHCCSFWGHDFRADYRKLGILKRQCPETPIIALSATSSPETTDDVCKMLEIPNTVVFRGSIDRPNLYYEVRQKKDDDDAVVADIGAMIMTELTGQCGIVYVLSRRETEVYSLGLRQLGIPSGCYHGDMERDLRNSVHEKWQNGSLQVVVATIAFGLGIDNQKVRFVIHATMAASLEGYYQESGRAGRDGKPARCVLLHRPKDFARLSGFVADKGDSRLSKMYDMYRYSSGRSENGAGQDQAASCRRAIIAAAFGESPPRRAKGEVQTCCDLCRRSSSSPDRPTLCDVSTLARSVVRMMVGQVTRRPDEKVTVLALATNWGSTGAKGKRMRGDEPPADRRISLNLRLDIIIGLIFCEALQEFHRHTSHAVNAYVTIGPNSGDALEDETKYSLVLRTEDADLLRQIQGRN